MGISLETAGRLAEAFPMHGAAAALAEAVSPVIEDRNAKGEVVARWRKYRLPDGSVVPLPEPEPADPRDAESARLREQVAALQAQVASSQLATAGAVAGPVHSSRKASSTPSSE